MRRFSSSIFRYANHFLVAQSHYQYVSVIKCPCYFLGSAGKMYYFCTRQNNKDYQLKCAYYEKDFGNNYCFVIVHFMFFGTSVHRE